MGTVWINPQKAEMAEVELRKWIALMQKHHPEQDWTAALEKLKPANVKGVSRKSKKD